jgi:outer membrane protein OmpA-like peptidoglycan-associated protein
MNKLLLLHILSSSLLLADCSIKQEDRAFKIWQSSIHKNEMQKLKLQNKALSICKDLEVAYVDKLLIQAKKEPTQQILIELKNRRNNLALPPKFHTHKTNIGIEINRLYLKYLTKERERLNKQKGFGVKERVTFIEKQINALKSSPTSGLKTVTRVGGTYRADLFFDKNRYKIKNYSLSQKIIDVIHQKVQNDSSVLFGLEGGASSEGKTAHNKLLSKHRAEALSRAILQQHPSYGKNIKIFAMGESQLVCEKGLLPERNSQDEYECITKEDREKSRRVTIRRLR